METKFHAAKARKITEVVPARQEFFGRERPLGRTRTSNQILYAMNGGISRIEHTLIRRKNDGQEDEALVCRVVRAKETPTGKNVCTEWLRIMGTIAFCRKHNVN
jgi:hypothetical protein